MLNEYITSVDGKPFPPHAPYLCPESLMKFSAAKNGRFNVSQVWIIDFLKKLEIVRICLFGRLDYFYTRTNQKFMT